MSNGNKGEDSLSSKLSIPHLETSNYDTSIDDVVIGLSLTPSPRRGIRDKKTYSTVLHDRFFSVKSRRISGRNVRYIQ